MANRDNRFRSALTKAELMSGDLALTAALYNKLGEFIIPAGLQVAIGVGDSNGQENAQGRIYINLVTAASALIPGTVRLSMWTAQNRVIKVVDEWRTEALQTSTDRTKQIPLPFTGDWLSKDKKYILEIMPDAGGLTVAKAQSTVLIDATKRESLA
jgi:hypothetical protein